jgi:hypothetical protein
VIFTLLTLGLALIAKWLLVIVIGLILSRLQPQPTGAQKSEG